MRSSRSSTSASVVCVAEIVLGVVDRRLRLARAVAVVVGREVVGDADQPRPQRPPLRLALRALEVPVGLQERLLREVLGVVVVAHPVVRVRVDVAQMRLVERREVRVEARLGRGRVLRCRGHAWEATRRGPSVGASGAGRGAVSDSVQLRGLDLALDDAGQPAQRGRVDAGRLHALGEQRHARDGLGGLAERGVDVLGRHALGEHLAGAAVARAVGHHGGDEVAGAGQAGERLGRGALVAGERVDLGEHLAGGGAGGVRPGGRRGGGGERGGVLGAAGELDADDVARVAGVEAGGGQRGGDLAAEGGVARADHERGAVARARRRRGRGRRARRPPRR